MELNLHIICEDLAEWGLEGNLPANNLKFTLRYPQLADSLPADPDPSVLYVVDAASLPDRHEGGLSLICLGEPPRAWKDAIGVLWTNRVGEGARLMNELARIFWRYARWERDVAAIFEEHRQLQEIGAVSQSLFANSIGGIGSSFRYLFISFPDVDDAGAGYERYRRTYSSEGAFMNERDMVAMVSDEQFRSIPDSTRPVKFHSGSYDCTALVCNVVVDGQACAQVVTNDLVAPLTKRDEALVCRLAELLARGLAQEDLYELTHPQAVRDVLSRLLAHVLVPEGQIERLLWFYGWHVDDDFAALVVSPRETTGVHVAFETLAMSVARAMRNDCYLAKDGDAVFAFNLSDLRVTREGLVGLLEEALAELPVDACLSTVFSDFKDLYYYACQAKDVLGIGLREEPLRQLHLAEGRQVDLMVARCLRSTAVGVFVPDGLRALLAYDAEQGTELVALLRAYLDNDRNAAETARQEYIHRNTLAGRLARIDEITGLDLNDSEVRFAVSAALRMLEVEAR